MSPDYYAILGIDRDAAPERVRQAYRAAVKECHPDASGTVSSAERFRAVEEAYETLRDKSRREAYDRTLEQRRPAVRRSAARGDLFGSRPVWTDLSAVFEASPFTFFSRASCPVLDVVLSPEEAARGLSVRVDVPVVTPCPRCRGLDLWYCSACGGSGRVRSLRRVDLEIPPGVRDDSEFAVELGLAGGELQRFDVHVSVEQA